jgi:carboxyl-terminal processing protease
MQAGDEIIRVDGVVPENIDDAVSRMTGEEGTKVTVTVKRGDKEIDLKMKRAAINLDSVAYSVSDKDPKVGYITIAVFAEDTADEFKEAVKELQDKGCDKFIVDLRNNGGGLTHASLDIADYLLPECMIMTEINKDGSEKEYKSDKSAADLDMVVLVNENTASASEILTAAIKDNKAGTVLGTKTYGKGVTQMSRQFTDGYAIKLTITEYLTPNGDHVQGKGIEPDIEATDEDILDKAMEELKN